MQLGVRYRAAYALGGVLVVGFDNELGKGDPCHIDGREMVYAFTTIDGVVKHSLPRQRQKEAKYERMCAESKLDHYPAAGLARCLAD